MQLIDSAQAVGVAIYTTVDGGNGDWDPPNEVWPIRLGYGAALYGTGVYFYDPATTPSGPANTAVIDVTFYSANDVTGGASLQGIGFFAADWSYLHVGMSSDGTKQTTDTSAILVENGTTLLAQGVMVNGSITNATNQQAILLTGGATLTAGGLVVGNYLGKTATNGGRGIVCPGCTINDRLASGTSALVIAGQELIDLDLEDSANVNSRNGLVVGGQLYSSVGRTGFGACAIKLDATSARGATEAVRINGNATVSIKFLTAQCIGSAAVRITANDAGTPNVTLDRADIENTDVGIYASAGTVTVTNSLIRYNHIGVQQASDGTNNGSIDLSGGGNTVVCSNSSESCQDGGTIPPGVDVLNASTAQLNASNVFWDTATPDYFTCDATLTSCSCNHSSCSTAPGSNDMDAVTLDAGITLLDGLQVSDGGCS
jgi:hypothetical protein